MALAILLAGSVVRWAFLLLIDEAHFIASTSGIRVAMVTSVDHMGVNTEPEYQEINRADSMEHDHYRLGAPLRRRHATQQVD